MKTATLLVGLASAACATPAPPQPQSTATAVVTPNDSDAPPVKDTCAEFNRRQNSIDRAEHERRYGCPPCPCACVNGEIRCAPCARCVPEHELSPDRPVPPPPEG